ncbi:NEDD8-activating enzyme E1 catalytic subunit [Aphelenchoides bicaudatus]|nr:NEDD8-activating enzyme E1 catalytic subunit [Aphelenchoides bicaudatus]
MVDEMDADRISVDETESLRWKDVLRLTNRQTKFAPAYFQPGNDNFKYLQENRILVLGAGGLGCEILKGLALSGFKEVDVIDMDTIDVTNLNRQFLFRNSDVGRSKAEVAAEFVNRRVADCKVTPHICKIQDKDEKFYRQFSLVICGLDSVDARRWINAMLCDLVTFQEDGQIESLIPLIDGGTEGFKGSARVIMPHMSACIECTLYLFPPQVNFPMCTIANTPRLPEHCIEYIKVVLWEKESPYKEVPLDTDNPDHIKWVFKMAEERAQKFGISGVNMQLTVGVLKRVIPAVATTNAIIANSCVLEAFKLLSNCALPLKNYVNFQDVEGATCNVVEVFKSPDCLACGDRARSMEFSRADKLNQLLENLKKEYQFRNPSVQAAGTLLYKISDILPAMKEVSEQNLEKTFEQLGISEGFELLINDDSLTKGFTVRLQFNE